MSEFARWLQSIDRRWIYLVIAVTFVVTLIVGKPVNPVILPPVERLYDVVDTAPAGAGEGKIILVGMTFSASTIGESGNQARVLLRHLMLTKKRFAVMSIEQQGALYAQLITDDIAKQYGYRYGEDWINFGYQLGTLAFFKSFPRDIPGMVKTDGTLGKPIDSFPLMQGIETIDDVAMYVEITASASIFDWIQIVQPATRPRLKIGYACTGVMTAEAYPFLDSGQLVGMMPGLKGAADYERLVDDLEEREVAAGRRRDRFDAAAMKNVPAFPRPARELMFTQGAAHIVVIVFIFLGNLGLWLSRRRSRDQRKEVA